MRKCPCNEIKWGARCRCYDVAFSCYWPSNGMSGGLSSSRHQLTLSNWNHRNRSLRKWNHGEEGSTELCDSIYMATQIYFWQKIDVDYSVNRVSLWRECWAGHTGTLGLCAVFSVLIRVCSLCKHLSGGILNIVHFSECIMTSYFNLTNKY